ncbi:MAG: tetratricopeptide repeat protein [bacterium]|nr:tetratricopeptide repeat protein [bacterium]
MSKKTITLIITCFFLSTPFWSIGKGFSKEEIRSLNESARLIIASDPDSAILLAEKAKHLALSNDLKSVAANSCYLLAYIDEFRGKLDKAAINYFECLRYIDGDESKQGVYLKVASLMNIGRIFYIHHQYTESIEYHKKGLEFAHKFKRDKLISGLNYNIAMSYKESGNYVEAVELLFEASRYAEKIDDYDKLIQIHRLLGLIFHEIEEFDRSREHYLNIFQFQGKVDGFDDYAGRSCHNIAFTYFEEGNFDKAEEFYLKAIDYRQDGSFASSNFISHMDLGELYLIQKDFTKSEEHYLKALQLDLDLGKDPDKFKIYKQLSTLYGFLGDAKKFAEYNTKYTECLEKHLKTSEELAQMDQQYNIQLVTQRYFELVESQKRMAALKKYGGFAVAGILSFILIFLIVSRIRKTRLKKSLEQELKEAMQGLDFDL